MRRIFQVRYEGPTIDIDIPAEESVRRLEMYGEAKLYRDVIAYKYYDKKHDYWIYTALARGERRLRVNLPPNLAEVYRTPAFDWIKKVQSHSLIVIEIAVAEPLFTRTKGDGKTIPGMEAYVVLPEVEEIIPPTRAEILGILDTNRKVLERLVRHYRFAMGGLWSALYRSLIAWGQGYFEARLRRAPPAERYRLLAELIPQMLPEPGRRARLILRFKAARDFLIESFEKLDVTLPTAELLEEGSRLKEIEWDFLTDLARELRRLRRIDYATEVEEAVSELEEGLIKLNRYI